MHRAMLPLLVLLSGCSASEPDGQVLATVDGVEVTRREMAEQVRANGGSVLDGAANERALGEVIDRKLLARAARKALVDRQPGHQIAVRRVAEEILIDSYLNQALPPAGAPDAAAINAFISDHPWWYADRYVALVDVGGERPVRRMIDSAALSATDAGRLAAAKPGARIALSAGEPMALIERWPLGMDSGQQQSDAVRRLTTARQAAFKAALLAKLRAAASIRR
jgi:hypothetical protein